MDWLIANLSTIIICAVLLSVVAAIVVSLIRNKKKGKTSCGCGCSSCPMAEECQSKKKK